MADDPRVVRSRAAVVAAVLDLIAERGIGDTTIDEIAQRSGVAKTTIYRHWTGKPEIVLDALSSVMVAPEDPDTGSLRDDLHALVGGFAHALGEGPLAGLLAAMMEAAERDPEFADLHRREAAGRHRVVRDAIMRGIGRGELARGTDPDEVLGLVLGPVVYQRLVAHVPVDPNTARQVVDRALRAYGVDAA